jgi:hypothetical protein
MGGQGALIHSTWMLAQTGAYSIVHAMGHSLPGVDHGFPGLTHVSPLAVVHQHKPLIYDRSSQTVPSGKVHIPTCPTSPPSAWVTIFSVHQFFIQLVDAGFANPTGFCTHVAY